MSTMRTVPQSDGDVYCALELCIECPDIVVHFRILREFRDSNNMSTITYHTGYMYGFLDAMRQSYRNTPVAEEIAFLSDFLDFRFR